jgi:hypothetical protein
MASGFSLPPGYAKLEADCRRFFADHPHYDRNVFIMTRFVPGNKVLAQLDEELRKALCRQRLTGIRADDRLYPDDEDLWDNVCVHMLCCRYGVAVLEDRVKDEFNPNVALEYGFMRALNKRVLLLADVGFRNLRADIVGTVRKEFDLTDISGTLTPAIEQWAHDLGLDLRAGPGRLQQQALQACRRLLNIRCARLIKDEARRNQETEDEFWYFGEDIQRYRAKLEKSPDTAHQAAVDLAYERVVLLHDHDQVDALIERFAELTAVPPTTAPGGA